jgi:hypothetical protein
MALSYGLNNGILEIIDIKGNAANKSEKKGIRGEER